MEPTLVAARLTLLPAQLLHTHWFAVLAAFVALNTVMYCALSVAKMLPKLYLSDLVHSPNRRSQTRSIYPDGHVPVPQPSRDPATQAGEELADALG